MSREGRHDFDSLTRSRTAQALQSEGVITAIGLEPQKASVFGSC